MTDLSTPAPAGLPPMTLEAAVDLANRITAIQKGLIDLINRGDRDQLLDHAATAYKALIVLFDHTHAMETAYADVVALLQQAQQAMVLLFNDPDIGETARWLIDQKITQGEEMEAAEALAASQGLPKDRAETDALSAVTTTDEIQADSTTEGEDEG